MRFRLLKTSKTFSYYEIMFMKPKKKSSLAEKSSFILEEKANKPGSVEFKTFLRIILAILERGLSYRSGLIIMWQEKSCTQQLKVCTNMSGV